MKRDFEKAAAELALALSGRHVWAMGILAETYAEWCKNAEAKAIYAELVARSAIGYMEPFSFAMAAAAAGKRDRAMELAREALKIPIHFWSSANTHPVRHHYARTRAYMKFWLAWA